MLCVADVNFPFHKFGMKVFYIDPQSYNNLSVYDSSLLLNIEADEIFYFHNVKYQCEYIDNVTYRGVFSYSDKTSVFKALSYVMSILRIVLSAFVHRPDIIHIQWFRLYCVDRLMVDVFRLLGAKVVHTAHNIIPHNPSPSDRNHFHWFYCHSDAIIVHTLRSKEELLREFHIEEDRVHVIPHGILPSTVNTSDVEVRMKELQSRLHTDGCLVFSSMGFQNYYKGIDIISEVWRTTPLLRDNPQCMLLIVGKVEAARLDDLYDIPNIHIVNEMVSDLDFDAYLGITSVALLPYRKISQSGVLLTALHRNIPVLVSDVGGLTEPLRHAQVGWNIGQPSVESLRKTMVSLIENPDKVLSMRNDTQAFEKVKALYSWDKIGAMTSELYKRL